MIIDELTLANFGVYRGRHKLDLTPPSEDKPVILIGALNGGGKTTLLDALQLVLYGKRARCSNRGELSYEEFLRRAIHRYVPASEGAGIELRFRHWTDGQEHTYKIRRFWYDTGRSVPEQLEIFRDGVLDKVLTESWNEAVEEFIPQGIASLFLFDGEKIESLAEPATARQVFATAVNSLLGVDLLEQLSNDLVVLERKRRAESTTGARRQAIKELEQEVQEHETTVERVLQERASLQSAVDQHRQRVAEVEERLRNAGGDLYEQRAGIELELKRLQKDIAHVEHEMRELAEGPLVFQLVPELLDDVIRQGEAEVKAIRADLLLEELQNRDAELLEAARRVEAPAAVLATLRQFLESDRTVRAAAARTTRYLGLDGDALRIIQTLVESTLPTEVTRARTLVDRHSGLQSELVDCERRLAQVPDEGAIAIITAERNVRREKLADVEARLLIATETVEQARQDLERKRQHLVSAIEAAVGEDFDKETAGRVVEHARKVRETLKRFRVALLERHLTRIARLVTESYKRLMRKQSMIGEVQIDPETFGLKLLGTDGEILPTERLAAGERQLLAVSMLWGLAQASGRPLPAVIDTPMGRLDSVHRTLLVERYFPFASHQVLILSTDEEIDQTYYPLLAPWVGRAYQLRYEEAERHTAVHQGYFF
jgi:DNA sulfur modification protein DndD